MNKTRIVRGSDFTEEIAENIINAFIKGGMSEGKARFLLREYDSTFNCERYSETWSNCRRGTKEEDYRDLKWCRPCIALYGLSGKS